MKLVFNLIFFLNVLLGGNQKRDIPYLFNEMVSAKINEKIFEYEKRQQKNPIYLTIASYQNFNFHIVVNYLSEDIKRLAKDTNRYYLYKEKKIPIIVYSDKFAFGSMEIPLKGSYVEIDINGLYVSEGQLF